MSEQPTHPEHAPAPIGEPAPPPAPEVPPVAFINPIGMRANETPPESRTT